MSGDGRSLGVGTHNTVHSGCVVELGTRDLHNFVNQCHPNTVNEKDSVRKSRKVENRTLVT